MLESFDDYAAAVAARSQPKERDIESGLDYFLARYYSSAQGRFTSPDEFAGGPDELYDFADEASDNPTFYSDLIEPQSLHKYQYCYNNPLSYVDLLGHQAQARQQLRPVRVEYEQSTGRLTVRDHNDNVLRTEDGYAGHGQGVNNPDREAEQRVGPIPRGEYNIGPAENHPTTGPVSLRLTPSANTDTNIRAIEVARIAIQQLSILKLHAFNHSLADAERILGSGVIEKNSGESVPKKLCYCSANAKDKTRLVLYAGPSGGWENITGFALLPTDSALERCENCTQSKLVSRTLSPASGIRLGMTRTQFEAAIGHPPEVANDRVLYLFHAVSKRASIGRGMTKGATRSSKEPSQEFDYSCFIEGGFQMVSWLR